MNPQPLQFETFIADAGSAIADFRHADQSLPLGDRRDGLFYHYTPEIKLAVRVALAVGRPLLLLVAHVSKVEG